MIFFAYKPDYELVVDGEDENGINLHGVWRQPMKVFCRNLLVKNLHFKLL